jgi:hypothetical protein
LVHLKKVLRSVANSKYKPGSSTALKAVENSLDERTTALRNFKDSYKGPFLVKRGRGAVPRSSQKEYRNIIVSLHEVISRIFIQTEPGRRGGIHWHGSEMATVAGPEPHHISNIISLMFDYSADS